MKVASANSGDVGDDKWPPGFRFHPTDEELVLYYLKRKICKRRLRLDIIRVLDVYKWDPEELPGQSILHTGDRQWFFFTPRDRKYPNGGGRSNRATGHGYWKATGKDRNISCSSRTVGIKKTLVFYRGRAPHGERTDWVMHEYTLDEEELKRCLNAQEYYALYKVYKKSGPGPKNGEQYGAPFKEEDWADEEFAGALTSVAPNKQQNVVAPPADNAKAVVPVEPPLTVEDFLCQISKPLELPEIANNANGLQQVASEGETRSTLVDAPSREVMFPEMVPILPTSNQQCEREVSLSFNQSTASKIQTHDAAEVTPVPTSIEGPLISEDDFLEIDDFIGPEPTTFTNPDKPEENFCFDDFNGLSEFDLYHDADLFWNDMGSIGQETVSHVGPVGSELLSHSLSNQIDYHLQPCSSLNQVDNHLQLHSDLNGTNYFQPHSTVSDVNYLESSGFGTDQLWESYPRSDAFTSTESPQGTFTQPTSGVIHESTNNLVVANQNQSGEEDVGSAGWFSSTLWAYVDSIPHTPASAMESPLVNKAFERMSSFSRVRTNYKNNGINGDDGIAPIHAANARKTVGSRGLLFLSVIGVLCAVLWVLVGTVTVLGS